MPDNTFLADASSGLNLGIVPYLCALPDPRAIGNHCSRVYEDTFMGRFCILLPAPVKGNLETIVVKRILCTEEYLQNAQSFIAIGIWRPSVLNALDEVFALHSQWFIHFNRYNFCVRFAHDRGTVLPLDLVRIEEEFFSRQIIKDCHLTVTDNDQFLFLVRV